MVYGVELNGAYDGDMSFFTIGSLPRNRQRFGVILDEDLLISNRCGVFISMNCLSYYTQVFRPNLSSSVNVRGSPEADGTQPLPKRERKRMSKGGVEEEVVCVTGASGYVASWIVKLLLHRGYTVKSTLRNFSDLRKTGHLKALEGVVERLELLEADLVEEGSFDSVIDGCVGVFHTASPVIVATTNPQVNQIILSLFGNYSNSNWIDLDHE